MELNIGTWDRILRVMIGISVLTLMFIGPKSVLELLGIIPLVTGLAGHSPLYALFRVSTCPRVKHVGRGRAAIIG